MSTIEFNQLLLSNADFLRPFAINLTKDHEAAKDLCQETLCKALANREKYSVGTNIKAWLYTIMRNIFINNYRKAVRQNTVFDRTANEYLLTNRLTTDLTPEGHLNLKEVNKAISELPEIFKTSFMLFYEGYKYNEISDILNEPLGTIKSRIHFARKLLKETIQRN